MAFTVAKGLSVQGVGDNVGTWGSGASDSLNTGCFEPLDNMLGGINTQTLASTTPIAFNQETAQKALIRLTGVLLASIVIGPDTGVLMQGFYYFENLTTGSFTVTFTNTGGSVVLPQGRRGVLWVDTTYGPRVMSSVGSSQTDIVPAGSVLTFYNNAAPTGYTVVSLNDYALKVVNSGGGSTSGSVLYSTLFSRTSTDSYTLLLADVPAHTHSFNTFVNTGASVSAPTGAGGGPSYGGVSTDSKGGGGGHSHGLDMRVQTAAVILATRN